MRRHGFTLIEMMIVVAIIALVAAIAIPNLLAARRQANEANAIAACKEVGFGQTVYRRTDWDGDGLLEYVTPYSILYSQPTASGVPIALITEELAAATAPAASLHGYYFTDIIAEAGGAPYIVGGNQPDDYGICANPGRYRRSGLNTYIMNTEGTVYAKDQGGSIPVMSYPANARAAGWVVTQ